MTRLNGVLQALDSTMAQDPSLAGLRVPTAAKALYAGDRDLLSSLARVLCAALERVGPNERLVPAAAAAAAAAASPNLSSQARHSARRPSEAAEARRGLMSLLEVTSPGPRALGLEPWSLRPPLLKAPYTSSAGGQCWRPVFESL